MINNSSLHKWDRLKQKQLDELFSRKLQVGLNCSPFEAAAIKNLVYEVYQPFFDNSYSLQPGQIMFQAVSVENHPGQKLSDCSLTSVVLTLDAGQHDLHVREKQGVIGLRRHRLQRICTEAFQQGALLTIEDIANRLLNCGERTLSRDIKALKDQDVILELRSTIKDIGRSLTHRKLIVSHWLKGMEYADISRTTHHSLLSVQNYVDKFKRVIWLANQHYEFPTIAFLVKISISLVQEYYRLYQDLSIAPHRRKELNETTKKNSFQQ